MKVLVIPDCHLKPWMYKRAAEIMREKIADVAVSLMDIPDDWNKQYMLNEYEKTYDAVIEFAKEFPDTKFCYGNHDLCYIWNERESGYSKLAPRTVCSKLNQLNMTLPENNPIKFVQNIDNLLFCHGGLTESFVEDYIPKSRWDDIDYVLDTINSLGHYDMWCDESPIWFRPQYYRTNMFGRGKYIQVVGHTPVKEVVVYKSTVSCDLFSTQRDGTPFGTQEFVVIDSVTGDYFTIK